MVASKPHVYALPFPVQSHINPMLEFSKCLASNDHLEVTFIVTAKASKSIPQMPPNTLVAVESISDGSEEIQEPQKTANLFRRFREAVPKGLAELIEKQKGSSLGSPKLLVYDSVFPWMLDVARQHGLLGASFVTQSCSVSAVYYHIKEGSLRYPFEDHLEVELPSLPALGVGDLPLLEEVMDSDMTMLKVLGDQFSNLHEADFLLFNSFDVLENEIVHLTMTRRIIKTIGPTNLLLQNIINPDSYTNNHKINLFESNQEACTKWLDSREAGSVVYVSLVSIVSLNESQMEELEWGLMKSQCSFLWVVRASEEHKLPPGFASQASDRALIVNWCCQTDVLAHRSVLCFLTHGGWNSTMEGLSHGVPLVVMPHWVDQSTNAKFVEDLEFESEPSRMG